MSKTALAKKKSKAAGNLVGQRQMAAGEFKAKCLAIMDEVKNTGKSVVVTKRGEPVIKVVPIGSHARRKKSLLGRLVGVMTIVGDPDDLLKPIFPLEDYDMLK